MGKKINSTICTCKYQGLKLQFTDRPLGVINKNDLINIFLV